MNMVFHDEGLKGDVPIQILIDLHNLVHIPFPF